MRYRNATTARDPYWITAKYAGVCACGNHKFSAGARVFYYPNGKKLYADHCAEHAAEDFAACVADEYQDRGGY
jgi:hypothetical protein